MMYEWCVKIGITSFWSLVVGVNNMQRSGNKRKQYKLIFEIFPNNNTLNFFFLFFLNVLYLNQLCLWLPSPKKKNNTCVPQCKSWGIFFLPLAKLQLFAERTSTSSTDSSGSHVASTRESFLQRPRHPAPSAPKNKGLWKELCSVSVLCEAERRTWGSSVDWSGHVLLGLHVTAGKINHCQLWLTVFRYMENKALCSPGL